MGNENLHIFLGDVSADGRVKRDHGTIYTLFPYLPTST